MLLQGKMYSIRVEACARWIDCHVEDLDCFTIVKLEVALWTVLDCDASYCYIITPIEPQSLQKKFVWWIIVILNGKSHKLDGISYSWLDLQQLQTELIVDLSKVSPRKSVMCKNILWFSRVIVWTRNEYDYSMKDEPWSGCIVTERVNLRVVFPLVIKMLSWCKQRYLIDIFEWR